MSCISNASVVDAFEHRPSLLKLVRSSFPSNVTEIIVDYEYVNTDEFRTLHHWYELAPYQGRLVQFRTNHMNRVYGLSDQTFQPNDMKYGYVKLGLDFVPHDRSLTGFRIEPYYNYDSPDLPLAESELTICDYHHALPIVIRTLKIKSDEIKMLLEGMRQDVSGFPSFYNESVLQYEFFMNTPHLPCRETTFNWAWANGRKMEINDPSALLRMSYLSAFLIEDCIQHCEPTYEEGEKTMQQISSILNRAESKRIREDLGFIFV